MSLFKGKAKKVRDWLAGLTDRELEDEIEVIPKEQPPTPPPSILHKPALRKVPMPTTAEEDEDDGPMSWIQTKPSKEPLKPIEKSPMFTNKLKSMLKDNLMKRRVSNRTYGDIDHKRLYRISTTNKVFSRAEINSVKCYNIGLVVDCSGSMRDMHKATSAAICAMTLVRDFQDIANVAVLGFNVIEVILKDLHSSKIKEEHLSKIIGEPIVDAAWDDSVSFGNHDHAAIKAMHKILLGEKGDSIMVVLSDGQPVCGNCYGSGKGNKKDCGTGYNQVKWLKEALASTNHSRIVTLGIGICDNTVRNLYKECEIVKNPNDIYTAVLKLFGRTIKRRAVR